MMSSELTNFIETDYDVQLFNSRYQYIKFLGKGSFASVVQAIDKEKRHFAIKIINKNQHKNSLSQLIKEAEILEKLDHPNVIKFYSYMEGMNYLFLSLEYFEGCTLEKLIDGKSEKKCFEEAIIVKIVKELLGAINYIHKNEIYHRDIKPENILIKIDPKNQDV